MRIDCTCKYSQYPVAFQLYGTLPYNWEDLDR